MVRQIGQKNVGFTLTEVSLSMMVIGLSMLALMHSMIAGTKVNRQARDLTQATFLAQEIREWTMRLPFRDTDSGDADNPPGPDGTSPLVFVDDLDDLMGVTFTPPRNGSGDPINGLAGWSQTIEMEWLDPDHLRTVVTPGVSDVIRVSVTVRQNSSEIMSNQWLVTRRDDE